jgi:hypothetical protein
MEKEALKKIFNFLEKEDNKSSFKWKLLNDEPFTEDDLHIKGNLNLSDLEIETLPKGLKVGGDLFLIGCKNLTSLPEGLEVNGALYLSLCNKLKSLPKGLKVDGGLSITFTKLTKYTEDQLKKMVEPGFIKGRIVK